MIEGNRTKPQVQIGESIMPIKSANFRRLTSRESDDLVLLIL